MVDSADPTRRRHILMALVAGQIGLHAAMTGLRMALPLMLLRQGAHGWLGAEAGAGLLLGLFALAPVLTAVPAGRWTDRRGYHRPVRLAVVLVLLGGLLAVAAAAWPPGWPGLILALLLLASAGLVGAGANLGLIAIQRSAGRLAAHGRPTPDDSSADPGSGAVDEEALARARMVELKRVFSWLGVAPSISNVIGPLLAGLLIDVGGFASACAAMALLPLATLWWSARVPPGLARGSAETAAADPPAGADRPAQRHGVWALLRLPGLGGILLVNWFFSSSWDLHTFLVPLVGHLQGLSASAIGAVLGLFALSVTAVRLLIPLLAERLTEHHVLAGAMALVAATFAVYPWAGNAWTMGACATVLGLALGSVQPMIMSTMHQLSPADQQGEVIALRSAVISLSSAVLPLVFGLLGGAIGTTALFRGMALLLVCGLWLPRRLARAAVVARQP